MGRRGSFPLLSFSNSPDRERNFSQCNAYNKVEGKLLLGGDARKVDSNGPLFHRVAPSLEQALLIPSNSIIITDNNTKSLVGRKSHLIQIERS
jgi:hypothetical protein